MAADGASGGRGGVKFTERREGDPWKEVLPGFWIRVVSIKGKKAKFAVHSDREVRAEPEVERE